MILNKKATRDLILERLAVTRPALVGKLTRISERSYDTLQRRVQVVIDRYLEVHGTVGKTIDLI